MGEKMGLWAFAYLKSWLRFRALSCELQVKKAPDLASFPSPPKTLADFERKIISFP